jgi:hypothetical protein
MIQSFLVLLDDGAGLAPTVFDTVQDGRHFFTGVGIGRVEHGDAHLSAAAARALTAVCDYADSQVAQVSMRLVEIKTAAAARVRVRKTLEAAAEKDVVFFVCRSPEVLDAVVVELNVNWNPTARAQ